MSDFISKISNYSLLNYLFSGVIFSILIDKFTQYSLIQKDVLLWLFLYYFVGLVISRVGALFVKPLLKRISFLKFAKYEDFVVVSKKDAKIEILSQENNMYRTMISVFLVFFVVKTYEFVINYFSTPNNWNMYFLFVVLFFIFLFSYKRQTNFIKDRVFKALEKRDV